MKKTVLMSAAKKARIALAVMAMFGMSFVGARSVFAADPVTEHPVKIDAKNNIVCGTGAKAEKATASTVDPANDIVIGVNAIANDKNSIAIGTGTNAKAENSVAIGYGSVADAANTISFGSATDTSKNKKLVNLAAGTNNNDAATYGQVITSVKQNGNKLEFYTGTNTTKAMDVELDHPINFKGSNLVSNGATIVTDSTVKGNSINNIVIGDYAKASKGYDSRYTWESNPQYNIIIGNSAQAKGVHNIAMGAEATTDGTYGVVLGYKAQSKGEGIAIGAGSKATYGVAIRGTAEGSGTIAISNFSEAKGYFNTAIGYSSKATGSESSLAIGNGSEASEKLTVAIGYSSKASKEGSIAIGPWAEASGGNLAIGYNAKATGTGSVAYSGTASGESSLALGGTASGKSSYAFGGTASGKQSVSIGAGSVAKYDNVVSVGMGEDTQWWNSLPAYRRIVNMADGINEHDAATYGQIIKKDTYTISLDAAGNGNVVLKTNAVTDNDGPTIKVDASALETQIKQNASDITAVDGKIGTLGADGTYIKQAKNVSDNLVELDKQVKKNADDITIAKSTIYNVSSKIGTKYDGNYIHAVNPIGSDLFALDTQVKVNADAIGSLSANGTYIKKAKNVSENLIVLDEQVDKNKQAIDNITGNITNVDNKIGDLSADGHYILKSNKVAQNLSALDANLYNIDNRVGTFTPGSTYNYISTGKNVIDNLIALDKKVAENKVAIAGSAFDGSKLNDAIKNVDVAGGYKETTTNPNADTKGTIAGAINSAYQTGKDYTDKQLTDKVGTVTNGAYIEAGKNVAENLGKLDTQVKKNTDAIGNINNLNVAGKDNLVDAVNKAYEAATSAGANVGNLGDLTTTNKDNVVGAVNEVNNKANTNATNIGNLGTLDTTNKADLVGAVNEVNNKANTNATNIGDTTKLNGLGSNLSDAVVNVNNKVGTADELKALKDAGLGDNLAQATAAVNKKADKNAEAIDELGGRVDTLGGAVSKLDTKVNKVGAGAAALAALHPMEFDSDNKLTFAAGVGSYHGASAAAIGAFYRPSEQVMFSIAGNMGNGENMVNAGVSFALDRPSKTPTTKAALVKTVVAQNEQIAALNETLAEQNEKIARLEAMVEKLAAKQNA